MPVVEYTSGSGTVAWSTVDPTANAFDVEIWGGGAGGVTSTSISHSGGGGGGGGYSKKRYFGRSGTFTYSVGPGGSNGNPSGNGGATTFEGQTANGGSGGLNQFGGAGGTASGGDTNTTAASGTGEAVSSGGNGGDGGNASFTGGAGATGSTSAGNGLQPGGGGGGGTTTGTPNNPGGTGGAGMVRITPVAGVGISIGLGARRNSCGCPPCDVVHGCAGWPTGTDLKLTIISNYASIDGQVLQAVWDAAGGEFDFRCPKPRWYTNFSGAPGFGSIVIPTVWPDGVCNDRGIALLLDCKAVSNGSAVDPEDGDGKLWLFDAMGLFAPWNGPEMKDLAGGCLAKVAIHIESNTPFVARSGVFYHMCESTFNPSIDTTPCENGVPATGYCPGCTTYTGPLCTTPSANALAVQVLIEEWP